MKPLTQYLYDLGKTRIARKEIKGFNIYGEKYTKDCNKVSNFLMLSYSHVGSVIDKKTKHILYNGMWELEDMINEKELKLTQARLNDFIEFELEIKSIYPPYSPLTHKALKTKDIILGRSNISYNENLLPLALLLEDDLYKYFKQKYKKMFLSKSNVKQSA